LPLLTLAARVAAGTSAYEAMASGSMALNSTCGASSRAIWKWRPSAWTRVGSSASWKLDVVQV
jgi:hypothetical protein